MADSNPEPPNPDEKSAPEAKPAPEKKRTGLDASLVDAPARFRSR